MSTFSVTSRYCCTGGFRAKLISGVCPLPLGADRESPITSPESPGLSTINTQLTTLLRFLRPPITDLSRRSYTRTLVGVGGSRITSAFSASSGSFFNFFAGRDTGKQYDPGRSLGGSILTEGRFERQLSGSDLV